MLAGLVDSREPFMAGRFGSVEIQYYINQKLPILRPILNRRVRSSAHRNAGIFPWDSETRKRFVCEMDDAMPALDVLGSWRHEELLLSRRLSHVQRIGLHDLLPYWGDNWLCSLKDKRVLVVHPFKNTIRDQYKMRDKLFLEEKFCPNFRSLDVIVPPQTNGFRTEGYVSWGDALDKLKAEVDSCPDFDVALIGCGSYGMPIAAHIKRAGKIALHLGGSTQLLFGIGGRRWDSDNRFSALKTDFWCRPSVSDTIPEKDMVENGCYW